MKRILLLALFVITAFALTACAVQGSTFVARLVELPTELKLAIGFLVALVVDWLLVQAVAFLPWLGEFLGQYRDQIIAAVSGAVVTFIGDWLALIPPAYEQVATIALALVVAVLALYHIPLLLIKHARAKAWRGFRK